MIADREVRIAGDEVLVLSERQHAYQVRSGEAALFVVELDAAGQPVGRRSFLGAAGPGDIVLGTSFKSDGITLALIAVGVVPSLLEPWDLARSEPSVRDEALSRYISTLVGKDSFELDLQLARPIAARETVALAPGEHAHSSRKLTYVRIRSGKGWLLNSYLCDSETGIVPIGGQFTLRAHDDVRIEPVHGSSLHPTDVAAGVGVVHDAFWSRWQARSAEEDQRRETMRRATQAFDERALRSGLEEATHLFERNRIATEPGDDPVVAAARIVAQTDGITIVAPRESHSEPQAAVQAIAIESRLSIRRVRLRGGWQRREHGPMLAFRGPNNEPVALLPQRGGRSARYVLVDPTPPVEPVRVDDAVAAQLDTLAYVFLRPFPERPIGVWDLMRFGLRHSGIDAGQILGLGLLGGNCRRHDSARNGDPLRQYHPGRNASAAADDGPRVACDCAYRRSGRSRARLGDRAPSGASRLDAAIGGYGAAAGVTGIVFPAIRNRRSCQSSDGCRRDGAVRQRHHDLRGPQRRLLPRELRATLHLRRWPRVAVRRTGGDRHRGCGRRSLRHASAAAPDIRPFGQHRGLRTASFQRHRKTTHRSSRNACLRRMASPFRYDAPHLEPSEHDRLPIRHLRLDMACGDRPCHYRLRLHRAARRVPGEHHIAASAAFGQLLAGLLGLGDAFVQVIRIIPLYERAQPLLHAMPEILEAHGDPGTLSGALELRNLSFRYENASAATLDRLDLKIEPGSFVALVGPSGSGKSTLFRLLLGFEKPSHGSVLYDGHDLASLDLAAVRRQIGSVLQSTGALQASIFENIAGARFITHDQAWDAARRVGIADDIARLPMQLETYLGSDGGGLSTGQRQRIAIARAIVTSPRILLFDEATSALDNETQAIVMKTLEKLDATRIVIAHRLSTIQNADRIVVLERGRILQDGNYADLIATPGPFADLAQRQSI